MKNTELVPKYEQTKKDTRHGVVEQIRFVCSHARFLF